MEDWRVFLGHQQDIDLILLDLSMPNMSGQELLTRIRAVDPTAKVIISSGRADIAALSHGEIVLRKPYTGDDLVEVVRAVLDRGEPRPSASALPSS